LYEITGNKTIMEFQDIIRPVSVFIKEKFSEYFLPINMEIEKSGQAVTHKDLLKLLQKKDRKGYLRAMIDHFLPYYSVLKKRNHETVNDV
jgi:GntR family transcriptional regulator, transcriptional repressor for pyruvate dehydrogenase complex